MIPPIQQFPFVAAADPALGEVGRLPYLPLTLTLKGRSVSVTALVDSGSTVNVLPYEVGLDLGAVWEEQGAEVRLSGNMANVTARVLTADGIIGDLSPIRLGFAWARSRNVPVILGQMNFFLEFDVYFFRSRGVFEVKPSLRV